MRILPVYMQDPFLKLGRCSFVLKMSYQRELQVC